MYRTFLNRSAAMLERILRDEVPDMAESPLLFRPGKSYADAERTPELKYWLCREYEARTGVYRNPSAFSESLDLPRGTFGEWWKKYFKHSHKAFHVFSQSTGGRRPKVDDIALNVIQGQLNAAVKDGNAIKMSQFRPMLVAGAEASAKRLGEAESSATLSQRSVLNYKNGMGASYVVPQTKTNARDSAEHDPRNVITMAVMCEVFCDDLYADMIFNWDATQYQIDHSGKELVIVIKPDQDDTTPVSVVAPSTMSFFVKHYHLHNAAGVIATPVFVIAADHFAEDQCSMTFVPNLGYNGDGAWLCFTKTRCGNPTFYRWFVSSVLLPFLERIRANGPYQYPDKSNMRAFICCDGEAKQIEIFQEQCVLDALAEHEVDLAKLPASCSGILQSSDVSPAFRSTKKFLANIATKNYANKSVSDKLADILKPLTCFTAEKKRIITESLLKISYAIRNSITTDSVKAGYEKCGQYPVSTKVTLSRTKYAFTSDEEKLIYDSFPQLMAEMSSKGQISEEFMNTLNIPKSNRVPHTTVPNDQRPLHQQRAVIMNYKECIAQWKLRQQRKLAKSLLESTTQKRKRAPNRSKAEILAEKEEKLAKKAHFDGLSKEEQQIQRKQKKLEKKSTAGSAVDGESS